MLTIIATIFVLFAISRIYLQFRVNHVSLFQCVLWTIIWGAVLVILYWPNLTERIAGYLGVSRGIDAVVYPSIVVLFYLIFRSYIKIEENERELTKLVRALALKDMEMPKKSRE